MKIRSAVPGPRTVVSYLTVGKKTKKTSVKHIRYRLIGDCVNQREMHENDENHDTAINITQRTESDRS